MHMANAFELLMHFRYPPQQQRTPKPSAEALARKFSEIRGPRPQGKEPMVQDDEDVAREYSKKRNDITQGKRLMELTDEAVHSEGEAVEAEIAKKPVRKPRKMPTQDELLAIFLDMEFKGTRYPHPATMKELGIHRDVGYLFEMCNLATFMSFNLEAFKEATCHFLASLNVHFYDDEPEVDSDGGLGYISFTIREQDFTLTIKQLDVLFGFPSGMDVNPDFDKAELMGLWRTIGGNSDYSSSRSKSAQIRSPVLRYMHKALANTFFARRITGTINESELQLIDEALRGILDSTRDGRILKGDRSDTGLTILLLDQLLSYKEWAAMMHKRGTKGELCVGGVVTPILVACGVDLDSEPTVAAPRWIDVPNLIKTRFLDRPNENGMYLYRFTHPEAGEAKLVLPCTIVTKIRMGSNIDFWPPSNILHDSSQAITQPAQATFDADMEVEPDRYYFEESAAPTQSHSLKEAYKRISLLQKWNKFQDKTITALKGTVRELKDSMKEMRGQFKELQSKPSGSSSSKVTIPPSALRRSGSYSIAPRRNIPIDPPRASSYERRQRKRRAADSSEAPESSSTTPLDLHVEPAYTRQSMEDSLASFFSRP